MFIALLSGAWYSQVFQATPKTPKDTPKTDLTMVRPALSLHPGTLFRRRETMFERSGPAFGPILVRCWQICVICWKPYFCVFSPNSECLGVLDNASSWYTGCRPGRVRVVVPRGAPAGAPGLSPVLLSPVVLPHFAVGGHFAPVSLL